MMEDADPAPAPAPAAAAAADEDHEDGSRSYSDSEDEDDDGAYESEDEVSKDEDGSSSNSEDADEDGSRSDSEDEEDSDSEDEDSEDEEGSRSASVDEESEDDDTAGADKVGMRIMQDPDLMRWALRTIVFRPNFDTAIETPTNIRSYLCEQFHIDPSSFTKEHKSRMEDILVNITRQVERYGEEEKELDPFCNEAMIMLLERHNLPSRQRDSTIVLFAKQFISRVEKDDDDLKDFWDEPDEDDFIDDFDAATAFLARVDKDRVCEEAITILLSRLNYPNMGMDLYDRTVVRFAKRFITNVKEDIHTTFIDTRYSTEEQGYDGLDSERDMEHEVEAAIRCCPEVLSRRLGLYPIKCLTVMQGESRKSLCNVKAVAFVPLFVRLAIEFHSFDETERGGLLVEDTHGNNVLHDLVRSSNYSFDDHHHEGVDTALLAVLIRLRQANLLSIGDIQHYELVHKLCGYSSQHALRRFRFLTEWCPSSLITSSSKIHGRLPLHWTVANSCIEEFQLHLDALFRFYPKWKGITALFQKDAFGTTSFEMACTKFTRNRVLDMVEEILVRYTTTIPPVNIGDALMMAAINDSISLDGVYFFMRRQPDIMLSMLRRDRPHGATATKTATSLNSINETSNTNDDTNDDGTLSGSTRKRKRN
jgi:hypothetical protein